MRKLDLKEQYKELYTVPKGKIIDVAVPKLRYLMMDGQGDPNTSKEFQDAIAALYSLSYALKFMVKNGAEATDYSVMPLEGLWWADDMKDFAKLDKSKWKWTAMIMQPSFITAKLVAAAKAELIRRKKDLPALGKVRLEDMKEGRCMQLLYNGPYSTEGPTIAKLHEHIQAQGLALTGKHREIYLNDARRTVPEKLRTIIRQPVMSQV